ncbi:hypothetical protein CEXT_122621 [Caerostris extrusa]|uniref:Uncharacterized protein n=1 Tax=Caerostris extrusa TaxID=172846 RepID=A0AAV4UIH9_CAEEX|nr:hypothetical protein CEXT_122621 [Caerostris extrusa]
MSKNRVQSGSQLVAAKAEPEVSEGNITVPMAQPILLTIEEETQVTPLKVKGKALKTLGKGSIKVKALLEESRRKRRFYVPSIIRKLFFVLASHERNPKLIFFLKIQQSETSNQFQC